MTSMDLKLHSSSSVLWVPGRQVEVVQNTKRIIDLKVGFLVIKHASLVVSPKRSETRKQKKPVKRPTSFSKI